MLLTLLRLSVKYWWHLNDLSMKNTNMLVVNALVENRHGSTNYFTWSGEIKYVLTNLRFGLSQILGGAS